MTLLLMATPMRDQTLRSTFIHRVKSASASISAAWQAPLPKHCREFRARGHARKSGERTAASATTWASGGVRLQGVGPEAIGPAGASQAANRDEAPNRNANTW